MFQNQQINEYVYKIVGRGCDCYLVLGDEETIMIDSECDKSRSSIYITNRETKIYKTKRN